MNPFDAALTMSPSDRKRRRRSFVLGFFDSRRGDRSLHCADVGCFSDGGPGAVRAIGSGPVSMHDRTFVSLMPDGRH